MMCETLSPFPQGGFSNVQPLPLIACGLDQDVDMGMWLIGMQSHHIAMLKYKLLPREVPYCRLDLFGRHSGRHGEYEFIDNCTRIRVLKIYDACSADPYLNRLLVANCEEALSRRLTKQGSFRVAVENAIVPLLPHGKVHAAEIARKLGLSQRTSARRLSSEGLSFSQVLEDLRSDLAKQYLSDQSLSVSRIAWLLGYQEVSAFTHAFKRWTGKTPREVRVSAPSA
jgi:AraC-like DNA-binding protein